MSDDGSERDYAEFAARLQATGIISDPWLYGEPRFEPRPVLLAPDVHAALCQAAEAVAAVYNELCLICEADPALVDDFFHLTPAQQLMWQSSAPMWHGIARADVFLTDQGISICEINSDTPSGEAEAVVLNAAVRDQFPGHVDPNRDLGDLFARLVAHMTPKEGPLSVGLLYPTEMTEDLSMILIYRQWFEALGWSVTLGSPYNLRALPDGRVALFDRPCDVFVRHYKTDWWGERLPVWDDETDYPDPAPLVEPLRIILGGAIEGACAVVNPFGAVLPQNKRAMALMWEQQARFPDWAKAAIRRYIPYTARLETLPAAQLSAEREAWVLKSDYGCEGDEVIVGPDTTQEIWDESLAHALPGRWIAQRYFAAQLDSLDRAVNHGVYLIAGQAAGMFCRTQEGATDYNALSTPTLITPP